MPPINVSRHRTKNYWNTAKDAVFGNHAFIQGTQLKTLQQLINGWVRTERRFLTWGRRAPAWVREISITAGESYNRALQPFLQLTDAGRLHLQTILTDAYGNEQRKPD